MTICRHGRDVGHEWLEDVLCPECEDGVDIVISQTIISGDMDNLEEGKQLLKAMTTLFDRGYELRHSHASDPKKPSIITMTFIKEERIPQFTSKKGIIWRNVPIFTNVKWFGIV